jgi:hypothetical protein
MAKKQAQQTLTIPKARRGIVIYELADGEVASQAFGDSALMTQGQLLRLVLEASINLQAHVIAAAVKEAMK